MKLADCPTDGWTLGEALDRFADPELTAELHEAERPWRAVGAPTRTRRGSSEWRVKQTMLAARARRSASFLDLLAHKKLVAFGSRDSPMAEPARIPPAAWLHVIVKNWKTSVIVEKSATKTSIFEVRIFPPTRAPDAAEALAGRPLVEVFRELVLGDPEVHRLAPAAIAAAPEHEPRFTGGFLRGHGFIWALGSAKGWLRVGRDEAIPDIGCLDEPPPPELVEAVDMLTDRFLGLLDLLAERRIVAVGIVSGSARTEAIPASVWRHRHYYLDVRAGDVMEFNSYEELPILPSEPHLYIRRWAAVMLEPPIAETRQTNQDRRRASTDVERTPRIAPSSSNAAQTRCRKWLGEQMAASPKIKLKPKLTWFDEARQKFGDDLSRRAFDRAWAMAIEDTGANAWQSAGPVRTSR